MADVCRKCGSWTELGTAGICASCYGGFTGAPGPTIQYIPCPQCARFREKLDREKMAKVIMAFTNNGMLDIEWLTHRGVGWQQEFADALIIYLKEDDPR
jgi:hypothetical protein